MLNPDIALALKINVRKNFANPEFFKGLNYHKFNCFMYAVGCDYGLRGEILPPLIHPEDITNLFGGIGRLSSKRFLPRSREDLIRALKNDLKVLGVNLKPVAFFEPRIEGHRRIALFYDTKGFESGGQPPRNFHFLREVAPHHWKHKDGWSGFIEDLYIAPHLMKYDEEGNELSMRFMGYFDISPMTFPL